MCFFLIKNLPLSYLEHYESYGECNITFLIINFEKLLVKANLVCEIFEI